MPKGKPKKSRLTNSLPTIHLNAAAVDIGSNEHWVAVLPDRDPRPVRRFTAFTDDLYALADWLAACGIDTVAMEPTGVYWIPLYDILELRGFDVHLVNAKHVQNVSGRKTDVLDCQWLQQLHTFGLLSGAFRPDQDFLVLRSYVRHRKMLIEYASAHVQHIQKALTQMNLVLHNVVSDVVGVTGMAILRDIVAGVRDREALAAHRDYRCKASHETIARSLRGSMFLAETGTDMTRWANAKRFVSWLGLCPGTKISGGKRLDGRTKKKKGRAATILLLAAATLRSSDSALGAFFRRKAAQFGSPKAIMATAHKLARIIYALLATGRSYVELGADAYELQFRDRTIKRLTRKAQMLGYELVALPQPLTEQGAVS